MYVIKTLSENTEYIVCESNNMSYPASNTRVNIRHLTAAEWASSQIRLAVGEPGYDLTNSILKIGNGSSTWNTLGGVTSIAGKTPEDFGAVGNGVTDDGDAIIAWASSGRNLFLPAKTYVIKRQNASGVNRVTVSFSPNTCIYGTGPQSVLQFDGSAAGTPAWYGCFSIGSNVTFLNLQLYFVAPTSPKYTFIGCNVGSVSNVTFSHVTVTSNLSFDVSGNSNTSFFWLSLSGNSSDFLFENCDISRCSYPILKTNDSLNTVRRYKFIGGYWHDNVIHIPFNSPSAICDNIIVSGVKFRNQTQKTNQEAMVSFASATNISITDCIFSGQFCREAIHIEQDCKKFTIAGNEINIDSQLTDALSLAGNAVQILSNNIGPTIRFIGTTSGSSTNVTVAADTGLLPGMVISGTDASGNTITANTAYIVSLSGTTCVVNTPLTLNGTSLTATAGPTVKFNATGTPLAASFTASTSSAFSTTVTVSAIASGTITTGMTLSASGTVSARQYIPGGVYVVSTNISGTAGTIEVNTPISLATGVTVTGTGTILTVSGDMVQGTSILPGMAITTPGVANTDGTYIVYGNEYVWYLNTSKTYSTTDTLIGTPGYANPTVNSVSGAEITVADGTGLQVGMNVYGTGISSSTYISAAGSNSTKWLLSSSPYGSVSGTAITAYANCRYNCVDGTITRNIITHNVANNGNGGISIVWDENRVPGGENIVITDNIITNYSTGIGVSQNTLLGTVISNNILKRCNTGIFTYAGTPSIRDNVFESCLAAFSSAIGGTLGRQTFINTTNYGKSTRGYLSLNGWNSTITNTFASLDGTTVVGNITNVLCLAGHAFSGTFSLNMSDGSFTNTQIRNVFAKYRNSRTSLYGQGCPFVNQPEGIAVGADGTIYISDTGNNLIKTFYADGTGMKTLISSGLNSPKAIALDSSGNLYIADSGNNAVKKWTKTTSDVSTLIASLTTPYGVAVDGSGNIYTTQTGLFPVKKWTSGGIQTATAGESLNNARGLVVDGSGKVYISEFSTGGSNGSARIWSGADGASYTTISGTGKGFTGATLDSSNGIVYFSDQSNSGIYKYVISSGSSVAPVSVASSLDMVVPSAIAYDSTTSPGRVIMNLLGSIDYPGTFNCVKSWTVGAAGGAFTSIIKSDPYQDTDTTVFDRSGASLIFSGKGSASGLTLGSESNPNKTLAVTGFYNSAARLVTITTNVVFNGTHVINPVS